MAASWASLHCKGCLGPDCFGCNLIPKSIFSTETVRLAAGNSGLDGCSFTAIELDWDSTEKRRMVIVRGIVT